MGPWHVETPTMRIRKICVGPWENNCYVVACRRSGTSVIVDAAAEADRVVAATAGTEPMALITTHGHFDHVGAAREVADRLDIPFRLHVADAETFGEAPDEPQYPGPVVVGELTIEVIHTPGHTPGSLSMAVEDVLVTGDTLFPGGPGATRGPGANFRQIMDSLQRELFARPDDTLVLPGHGLDTTIGAERPHLDEWRDRGW